MKEFILYSANELSRKRLATKIDPPFTEIWNINKLESVIKKRGKNSCILFYIESQQDLNSYFYLKNNFKQRHCLMIPIVNENMRTKVIRSKLAPITISNYSKEDFNCLIENIVNTFENWEKEINEEVIDNLKTYINTIKDKINSPLAALSMQSEFCLYDDTDKKENIVLHSILKDLIGVVRKVTNINLSNLEEKKYSEESKVYKI